MQVTKSMQPALVTLCLLHTFGRYSVSGRPPMEYETEIAASRLLKIHSLVELNSTGSDQVVLALATSGDLVASLRLKKICHKMTSNE